MQLTGGEGSSRGAGLTIRRAGYPVRARVFKHRRPQLISVLGGPMKHPRASEDEGISDMAIPQAERHDAALTKLRSRRRAFYVYLLSFVFLPIGVSRLGITERSAILLFGGWASGAAACSAWLMLSRCPKCRHLFHVKGESGSNPWAKACVNCGLQLNRHTE
jgi:hypothetical protein